MSPKKIIIDSDVILAHLTHAHRTARGEKSDFRRAMSLFFCYTTVFNAIELFALCKSKSEVRIVEDALSALKVLGLNAKSGKQIGELIRRPANSSGSVIASLIGGLCLESRLPLLTGRPRAYSHIRTLTTISASAVHRFDSAEALLRRAR